MNRQLQMRLGNIRQRSFWLRCFLEKEDHTAPKFGSGTVLKGHDFSRAENEKNRIAALA
jgi:hypothetical protein